MICLNNKTSQGNNRQRDALTTRLVKEITDKEMP